MCSSGDAKCTEANATAGGLGARCVVADGLGLAGCQHAMRTLLMSTALLLLATAACKEAAPPVLTITSPGRGLKQSDAGPLTVTGTAMPGPDGDRVAKGTVNRVAAKLGPDGSFTATLDVPKGAMLLETGATGAGGGHEHRPGGHGGAVGGCVPQAVGGRGADVQDDGYLGDAGAVPADGEHRRRYRQREGDGDGREADRYQDRAGAGQRRAVVQRRGRWARCHGAG